MDAIDIDTTEPQQNEEDTAVHICRVCLLDNLIMRDLFVEGDVVSLSTKAMSFASVKIIPGDGLPDQVCCECADKLESAYEFKLQVEQADSVLRERYDNLNIKEELFFNEVEVHLEADRTQNVPEIDVDAQYEVAAETLDSEVDGDKTDTLLKDHLALLEVEKLARREQHVLEHRQLVEDENEIQEQILQEEEQYIQDGGHSDEQMITEEIESGDCAEDDIKGDGMQEQEEITIEEHNYMIQAGYDLSSEQEQELLTEENVTNDPDTAEYLAMIEVQEMETKDPDDCQPQKIISKKTEEEIVNEVCEQEENQKVEKKNCVLSQENSMSGHTSDEDNYFENLNLSSRLSQYQVDKPDKVFFVCYICDRQFISKEVLKEHMHSHEEIRRSLTLNKTPEKSPKITTATPGPKGQPPSGKKSNKCPYCSKEYLYVISFNKHIKKHQKNNDTIKQEQNTSFHGNDSMDSIDFDNSDTFEIISPEKNKCDMKNEPESDSQDGSSSKCLGKKDFFLCKECQKQFSSKLELDRHFEVNHKVQKCNICDEEFDSLEKLKNHRSIHVIEGVITEQDLKEELISPTKKEFKQENNDHISQESEKIKQELVKEFKCQSCLLKFTNKKSLTKHQETHEGIKYRCKICSQEFTQKDHLRKHAEQHAQHKTFTCTQCDKNFGNELTLRNHLIATNHKTVIRGEEYDPNKRIKRVAARAAQKIIDKISTEDGLEDLDRYDDNDEYIATTHSKQKDLECEICGKKCISRQVLVKHMEYHSNNEKVEQLIRGQKPPETREAPRNCGMSFGDDRDNDDDDDDDDFDSGMDWPMDNHECTTCKKRYSTKKSLLRHQLLHEEPNFECDICNVKFYRKDKLKAHYDKCSEKNPDQVRKCNICGDTFENNEILREHRSKHVDEGILTEEDLRELEPGSEERREGEKIARKRRTDIVGLECPECNKQYTSRKGLLRHLQVHEGKKYLCDICPKKFYRREHLKIHVAKHNMVKPYKCTRCSKRFIKEEQLAAHLTKHEKTFKKNKEPDSTAKRWLCEICSKSFTQSTTLVAHLRAHKGIKPFVCEVCARPFTTNAYLKMHMRTHTHERPYTCQYCARAFARADTLANHLTSHTGEAKYHCKHCSKNFRRLKSLKEHVYIHTGQRPYACPTCDRRFNNNGSRYAHSKRCKQNLLQNQTRQQNQTQVAVVEQPNSVPQTIRLAQTVGPMQVIQSKNIKTITITRPQDQVGAHQLMQHQEILMPLILPLTVTLTDVDEEVILPEGTKIFTTT